VHVHFFSDAGLELPQGLLATCISARLEQENLSLPLSLYLLVNSGVLLFYLHRFFVLVFPLQRSANGNSDFFLMDVYLM
jgi:hypothetical protein